MTQAYCCHIVADFHQFTEATKGISCAIIGLAIPLDPDAVPGETTWIHEILDLCVVMVSAKPGEGRTGSCPLRRQLRSTESACFLQSKPTSTPSSSSHGAFPPRCGYQDLGVPLLVSYFGWFVASHCKTCHPSSP